MAHDFPPFSCSIISKIIHAIVMPCRKRAIPKTKQGVSLVSRGSLFFVLFSTFCSYDLCSATTPDPAYQPVMILTDSAPRIIAKGDPVVLEGEVTSESAEQVILLDVELVQSQTNSPVSELQPEPTRFRFVPSEDKAFQAPLQKGLNSTTVVRYRYPFRIAFRPEARKIYQIRLVARREQDKTSQEAEEFFTLEVSGQGSYLSKGKFPEPIHSLDQDLQHEPERVGVSSVRIVTVPELSVVQSATVKQPRHRIKGRINSGETVNISFYAPKDIQLAIMVNSIIEVRPCLFDRTGAIIHCNSGGTSNQYNFSAPYSGEYLLEFFPTNENPPPAKFEVVIAAAQ